MGRIRNAIRTLFKNKSDIMLEDWKFSNLTKENNKVKLGSRIKELRLNKRLSQKDVAKRLGIKRQAISSWERGVNFPSTNSLLDLCIVFDISIEELGIWWGENNGT